MKSTRRDTADSHGDFEEVEEEEKAVLAQIQGGMFGVSPERGSGAIGMEVSRMPQGSHQQQGLMRIPSTSPITASDYGFAKPKPLSRYITH